MNQLTVFRALTIIALFAFSSMPACQSASGDPAVSTTQPSDRPATPTVQQSPERASTTSGTALVERSRLRERSLAILEEAALSEWALLRANGIEGMEVVESRVEPFVRAGLADENLGVRYAAVMVTGRLRLIQTAPLVRSLVRDPDGSVRAGAYYALTRFGEQIDLTPLSELLFHGSMRERKVAAFVLGEIGNPSAVPLLLDATRRLQSYEADTLPPAEVRLLRLQIGEALAKLGEDSALNAIRAALYPAAIEELEASVLAAQILGEVKDTDAAAELVRIVTRTTPDSPETDDPLQGIYLYPKELRLAAARSLAQMGYPDGWYVGRQYSSDPDPAVRAQSAFVLAATRRSQDLPLLEQMLDDPEITVRVAAAASVLELLQTAR